MEQHLPSCSKGGTLSMRKKKALIIVPLVLISLVLAVVIFGIVLIVLKKDNSIPSTLQECYIVLNATLSDEEKNDIRNAGNGNLFRSGGLTDERWNELIAEGIDPVFLDLGMTHFGLGMWIRNNWIYPSSANIAQRFILAGVNHPDDMSSMIIDGYYLYLNGLPYHIPFQIKAIVFYFFIALILVSSTFVLIIGKYRKPSVTHPE